MRFRTLPNASDVSIVHGLLPHGEKSTFDNASYQRVDRHDDTQD